MFLRGLTLYNNSVGLVCASNHVCEVGLELGLGLRLGSLSATLTLTPHLHSHHYPTTTTTRLASYDGP